MILRSLLPAGALLAGELVLPFADIPNVTVEYYGVAGRDGAAIRRSIDSLRPVDSNDGKRVDALTKWNIFWSRSRDAAGKCSAGPDDIQFRATVTIPRLVDDRVPAKVRERFDRYIQSLLAHEDGHVRGAYMRRGEIAAAINGATCATAGAAAQAAVAAIGAGDIAYDRDTRHGSTTVLRFP